MIDARFGTAIVRFMANARRARVNEYVIASRLRNGEIHSACAMVALEIF
jgi:hypothetical protein